VELIREDAFISRKADGTVKQINPFTRNEVWTVPGRANRPLTHGKSGKAIPLVRKPDEGYCNFCPPNYLATPPEKSRMIRDGDSYAIKQCVTPEELFETKALFRRIPNLFEIVSFRYWVANHGYVMPESIARKKEAYLTSSSGMKHALAVVKTKLRLSGLTEEDIDKLSFDQKLAHVDAFFAGGHEVVVVDRHYEADAHSKATYFPRVA